MTASLAYAPDAPPPALFREMVFMHEILRRAGFLPDEIFVMFGPGPTGDLCAHIMLRTQGQRWAMALGPMPPDLDAALAEAHWRAAAHAWNQPPPHQGLWGFHETKLWDSLPGILMSILSCGIQPPQVSLSARDLAVVAATMTPAPGRN